MSPQVVGRVGSLDVVGWGDEIRLAIRSFLRTPWAIAGILLSVAIGSGLNSAVLAVTYGVLIRPLPYHEASRLAVLQRDIPLRDLRIWRDRMRTVDGLAVFATADHSLRGMGEPRIVRAAFVSEAFFQVLAPQGMVGEPLSASATAGEGVVLNARVLNGAGLDPIHAIGRSVQIAEGAFTVVGVLPSSAAFPSESVDVWIPASAAPAIPLLRRDDRWYWMLARMAPGVTLGQMCDDATRVARELAAGREPPPSVTVFPVSTALSGDAGPVLWALSLGSMLLLLVTSVNVAGLLLGRAKRREYETAIRLALGAGPGRVWRTAWVEALLLAVGGSLAGTVFAAVAVGVLRPTAAGVLPRLDAVRIDRSLLAIFLAIGLGIALLLTIVPFLYALKRSIAPLLQRTDRRATSPQRLTAAILVVVQLSLAIVTLTTSVLLVRTVRRLLAVDLGITAEHGLAMKLMVGERSLLGQGERRAFVERLLEEVGRVPGVQAVGIGSSLPPQTSQVQMAIRIVADGRDESQMMGLVGVRGDFLGALGTRVKQGRAFEPRDFSAQPTVVVLSQSAARHLFRGRSPIGQLLPSRLPGNSTGDARVIGVVDDVRYTGLAAPLAGAVYLPWDRLPMGSMYLVLRSALEPAALVPGVRAAIARADPRLPVADVRSLADAVRSSIADRRLHAWVASSFAVPAIFLSLVGLGGAVSRHVFERRRELAIRAALGSSRSGLVSLVLRAATKLAIPGVVVGLLLAAVAAKGLSGRLFGVSAYDPVTYTEVAVATILVAMLACIGPAYRAATVDPATLLRFE
jgi:putative ABC transport system permease protein